MPRNNTNPVTANLVTAPIRTPPTTNGAKYERGRTTSWESRLWAVNSVNVIRFAENAEKNTKPDDVDNVDNTNSDAPDDEWGEV